MVFLKCNTEYCDKKKKERIVTKRLLRFAALVLCVVLSLLTVSAHADQMRTTEVLTESQAIATAGLKASEIDDVKIVTTVATDRNGKVTNNELYQFSRRVGTKVEVYLTGVYGEIMTQDDNALGTQSGAADKSGQKNNYVLWNPFVPLLGTTVYVYDTCTVYGLDYIRPAKVGFAVTSVNSNVDAFAVLYKINGNVYDIEGGNVVNDPNASSITVTYVEDHPVVNGQGYHTNYSTTRWIKDDSSASGQLAMQLMFTDGSTSDVKVMDVLP